MAQYGMEIITAVTRHDRNTVNSLLNLSECEISLITLKNSTLLDEWSEDGR